MGNGIIKPKSIEISIGSANTVGNNVLIRCFNNTAAAAVLLLANSSGTISNTTIASFGDVIIRKKPTDTLTGTGFVATAIAFAD